MRIGVDLGGTKIEGIVLADDGSIKTQQRIPTPANSYAEAIDSLCGLITELQDSVPETLNVGIGLPGALSYPSELMKNCNSLKLNGHPLKRDVEQRLGYEVRIENDANCFALSEAHYGSGADAKSVFGVIIGTGCGGGLVYNKQLITGPNSIAGEWGHNALPSSARELIGDDRFCYCGRKNCIETVLSGRGMAQTHAELTKQELSAKEIAEYAAGGDTEALATIGHYANQLGRCLATIINVFDPEVIVLGGGLSNITTLYQLTPTLWRDYIFTDEVQTKLLPPTFGDASGARGAACLWPTSA